ncbi:MAG: hypothetical protein WA634_06245 [Silvibacterium sp.]
MATRSRCLDGQSHDQREWPREAIARTVSPTTNGKWPSEAIAWTVSPTTKGKWPSEAIAWTVSPTTKGSGQQSKVQEGAKRVCPCGQH